MIILLYENSIFLLQEGIIKALTVKKNKERIKNYATERYHSGNGEKKAK